MCAGQHVHLGKDVYINFNCIFVDDANIYIGNNTMISAECNNHFRVAPCVAPSCAARVMAVTSLYIEAKNVWLASNVTVMPGVHIGDNSIIGAGSVVTEGYSC